MAVVGAESAGQRRIVLWTYGFRPFFLLAGLWAIAPMLTVAVAIGSGAWPADAVPLFAWHAHEMLFGFAAAAIAGFLLTAVPNWTGARPIGGYPLAMLVGIWLAGRAASTPWWEPAGGVMQALSVAFFPALVVAVARPVVAAKNYRNLPFVVFLTVLFTADLAFQAARYGWIAALPIDPLRLAVNTLLLMIVIVGGRIIPAFTRNAFAGIGRNAPVGSYWWLDAVSIATTAAVLVIDLVVPGSIAAGVLALSAAALLVLRIAGWQGWRTRDIPLLWVLHLGYAWLVVALALKGAWLVGGFAWAANWLHALTLGAVGTMVLGVTTRAALGHTGRPLRASRPVALAYGLVSAAAILRVWGPWLFPGRYWLVIVLSIAAWVSAYAVFLVVYAPILTGPRVDAKSVS